MDYQKLQKQLQHERTCAWEAMSEKERKDSTAFAEAYKEFLSAAKTERTAITRGIAIAEANGFTLLATATALKPGDKVYAVNRNKALVCAVVGEDLARDGCSLVMAHVDSPHLDLKVNPLYEDGGLALFKTHYYGGIKKYQWPTIPLALHGTVVLESGKKVTITIGEEPGDPVFMITDLLPHLGKQQMEKKLAEAIAAEELNIVVGSLPVKDGKVKNKIKLAILEHLHTTYGMREADFTSAEIHAVTAGPARDVGFDRSLIAGFGHDDRVCAYGALRALASAKKSKRTQVALWIDREEIGSEGNTGAQSLWLESVIADILKKTKQPAGFGDVQRVFEYSHALSADVTAGFDPDYKQVHDHLNSAYIGKGVAIEKHTGHGGKYMSSEASAEYMASLRSLFAKKKIVWQTGGLGKVDVGGGGTIAMYLAKRNMDVIDIGIGVLNMHAPIELVSKADVYQAYRAYQSFFEEMH